MKKSVALLLILTFNINIAQELDIKKIDAIVTSKIEENEPGLFVGIVKNGEIIYENYSGLASLQHQVKIDKNTRSNIASTAKQFTALMILQLVIDEKLKLEDDIRTYLPKLYPAVKEKIKIRHLLNHTSGIRDFYDLMSIQQNPWWSQEGLDNDTAIELIEKQEDLAFNPGSRYMYSNSGYTLLAKIIANVTEQSFHEYSQNFFENLGMKNTSFLKNYMHVIPNQALPYSDWGDGVWQQYPMITNLYGDGFLFTTLKDQLLFEQAIQNAKKTNNQLLIESQKPIPNSEITTYGFGLEFEDRLNYKAIHHSGGTGSYHSQVVRYPDEKLSIFVMSNNSNLWSGSIADEIALVILPKKEAKDNYDNRINNASSITSFNTIEGQYLSPNSYLIRIESKDDTVYWRNGNNNPIAIIQEDKNSFAFEQNPKLKIGFYENELVLFYPSGKAKTYSKIPLKEVTISDLESYEGKYYSKELDVEFIIKHLENNKLMISLPGRDDDQEIEVLNKNELLIFDYILKVQRDQFNRVTAILLTTNRVLNNKFIKKTNLKFQPKIPTKNGSIQVTTIGSRDGQSSQILLTKNYENGNEIWSQQFGGKSYDKASSIINTKDGGYLIIGSTSSFGNGNYDVYVIKVDDKGKEQWSNSFGEFYNEYGYTAELTETGYLIKGTKQNCSSNSDVLNRTCTTNAWFINIDKKGKEVSNTILEEIKHETYN